MSDLTKKMMDQNAKDSGLTFTDKSSGPTSPIESGIRGFASGALFGAEPQVGGVLKDIGQYATGTPWSQTHGVADEQAANSKALNDNPKTYGAGYLGGATTMTAVVPEAKIGQLFGKLVEASPTVDKAAKVSRGLLDTAKSLPYIGKAVPAVVNPIVAPRVVGNYMNQPDENQSFSQDTGLPGYANGGEIMDTSPFGKLQNFLSANQMQKKSAMDLQTTAQGRAETNDESPLNQKNQ